MSNLSLERNAYLLVRLLDVQCLQVSCFLVNVAKWYLVVSTAVLISKSDGASVVDKLK